jgi:cytochrome P450
MRGAVMADTGARALLTLETPEAVFSRLMTREGLADPYPYFRALREIAPVCRIGNVYFGTGYAECREVLGSPDFLVQDPHWYDANLPGWRDSSATRFIYHSVQSRNHDDHSRLRRPVGAAFSPRRMAGYAALVDRSVAVLLDRMADAGGAGGPVDLMAELAYPLPTAVIGEMLGVPEPDREHFRKVGVDFFRVMDLQPDAGAEAELESAAQAMLDYWTDMVAQRRSSPREDLTSDLTAAHDAGELSEEELLGILMFLFTAGYGTTAALIGNATAELIANPAEARRLRADGSLVNAVVEETLRHDSPVQVAPRIAVRDCTVGGVHIPAGKLLVSLVGAANRDPAQFPDPDRFWPSRPAGRVLSFGGGVHFCIGAALARMEAAVALPRLLERFPQLAPAGDPEWRPGLLMRLPLEFPVSLRG